MDGRTLPKDPNPTWMGYSVGKWDGDALVVTQVGSTAKYGSTSQVIHRPTLCT